MNRLKVVLLTGLIAILLTVFPVYASAAPEGPTVSVSGSGAVTIVPDVATINLGVSIQDENAHQAVLRNNALTASVIEAIKAQDIPEEDIRTVNFSMNPVFDHSGSVSQIVGYEVSNSVQVTIRDVDRVGYVLGAATAAGANVSGRIQFDVLDRSAAYNEALELAVQNATEKADSIARALGMNILGVVSVNELGGTHMPVARAAAAATFMMEADFFEVPVQAGELTVTANIQVIYSLAP
ncbi:MAG: SIMPL domain-containing protein [Defluviitaleaceae bacterium]|nr:SIMPL domain-containing protein [Defluviitaleaceae bacterium]